MVVFIGICCVGWADKEFEVMGWMLAVDVDMEICWLARSTGGLDVRCILEMFTWKSCGLAYSTVK